jgi:hypothetical protein
MQKDILKIQTNQWYYHSGTMRITYPALFGYTEIVLSISQEEANEFKQKIDGQTLQMEDFEPYRENSVMVNHLFQMIALNNMFKNQDGRFILNMEGNNVFLYVNGAKVPAALPDGLWENILTEIEAGNNRNILAYIRFFARLQQNPYKPVRQSVMGFLQLKGEKYCISEAGALYAFKQLKFFSKGNQIVRDANALRDKANNSIKKAHKDINMFYLDGEPFLTEMPFENIVNKFDASYTVQWIGNYADALAMNPDLDTYTDGQTGNFRIVSGMEVREPLAHVETDPNKTCVKGLHVYPLNWNNGVYTGGVVSYNDPLFVIEIAPIDIAAIPNRKNYDKSRVCAYRTCQILERGEDGKIIVPEMYANGIVYGDDMDMTEEFIFPNIDDDISTVFVTPDEPETSQRFEIDWG